MPLVHIASYTHPTSLFIVHTFDAPSGQNLGAKLLRGRGLPANLEQTCQSLSGLPVILIALDRAAVEGLRLDVLALDDMGGPLQRRRTRRTKMRRESFADELAIRGCAVA